MWVPTGTDVSDGDQTYLEFSNVAAIVESDIGQSIEADLRDGLQRSIRDPLDISSRDLDWTLLVRRNVVLFGEFEVDDVVSRARELGYSELEIERHSVYSRDDGRKAVGISETALVFSVADDPVENVVSLLETPEQPKRQLHRQSGTFSRLGTAAGAPMKLRLQLGDPIVTDLRGVTASASSQQFRNDRQYLTWYLVFEDKGRMNKNKIRSEFRATGSVPHHPTDVTVDGRLVRVEKRRDAEAPTTQDKLLPLVGWRGDYDGSREVLTVTHVGGDRVRSERLTGVVVGESSQRLSPEKTGEEITEGDQIQFSVPDGETLRLIWRWGVESTTMAVFSPTERR